MNFVQYSDRNSNPSEDKKKEQPHGICGTCTTGASNDIEQATNLARMHAVAEFLLGKETITGEEFMEIIKKNG